MDKRTDPWRALRWVAALLIVLVVATTTPAPAVAVDGAGDTLMFEDGEQSIVVGPNAVIRIDGTITYARSCPEGGVREGTTDFLYPATDVYIVPAGSAGGGGQLQDVSGSQPNTIVATTTGAFIGELIAVTAPTGQLGAGSYDVVYDTCQDGVAGPDDSIFEGAITVEMPDGELPPVDQSILQLKEAARVQYVSWLQAHLALKALFQAEALQELLSCIVAPEPACLTEILFGLVAPDNVWERSTSWVQEQTLTLVMNRARNYGAIWQDPPDADFEQLPVIERDDVPDAAASGSPLADALHGLTEAMADEGALSDSLLHAIERYQGAQAAGDGDWALVQARAVGDLSTALSDQLSSSSALQDLRDVVAGDIDGIAARAADGAAEHARIRASGFTADERRALANVGLDAAAIAELESGIADDGQLIVPTGAQLLDTLDGLLDARSGMVAALDASDAGWDGVAASLESGASAPIPTADAGGPYTATAGSVQLDAGASSTPAGSSIVSFEWDLDGDGAFDDATGATPTFSVDGDALAAVKVTNDAGHAAVDLAVVSADATPSPMIDGTSPDPAVVATVGATVTFQVSAAGAAGDAVTYDWTWGDGAPAGTGATFEYTPTSGDIGQRLLSATVTSGGSAARRWWSVTTLADDNDGDGWTETSDCDDTRADVHPGGFERIGNDRDDDCDPATPDEPVGGLTGEVWSWGYVAGVGTGSTANAYAPVHVTTLPDDVRAVESGPGGYAVLADGTVRSWGYNYDGVLGDGTLQSSRVPVTVQNVGGGGALGNVVDLSSGRGHVLALLADGTVRAWGANGSRELGDGTAQQARLTPVVVLDENGDPLSGVAQVDTSTNSSYAVMEDGTVKAFGLDHCVGSVTPITRPVATTNALWGDGVVQLETGTNGAAIARNADGTVTTCAASLPLLGRPARTWEAMFTPHPVTGFGPASGAIDVAMGYDAGLILTEDGTVWTWGYNANHELDIIGVPGGASQMTPVPVPLPPGPPVVDVESDDSPTMIATRADGSVVVWGANVYGGGGVGNTNYAIVGSPTLDLGGGQAISVTNSAWNGLALVRPVSAAEEPARPLHWIDAAVDDAAIGEASGGDVAVQLSAAAPVDVTIDYEFDGEAGSVVVPAGETSAVAPVAVVDDTMDEPDEQLPFTVTAVSNGMTIGRHTATVTVVDDDDAPTVSAVDATVTEGGTSLTPVTVDLELSAPSARDIVVDYATVDGTATATSVPGDYDAAAGSTVIPAGATTAAVHLGVVGDTVLESNETFALELTGADDATIGDGDAVVTIVDDEPIAVTVASPTVIEGDAGTTDAEFTVSVTAPPAGETITVPWSVAGGTAELGADVLDADGELVLDAGTPSAAVVVDVVADDVKEDLAAETFRLVIGDAVSSDGRTVLVADAPVATILDDDDVSTPGTVVDAGPDVAGLEGTAVAIVGTVDDAAVSGGGTTVTWSVDDSSCTIDDPHALATSVTCADEAAATLTLTLDDGTGSTTSDTAALRVDNVAPAVTITDPGDGSSVATGVPVGLVLTIDDPGNEDTVTCSVAWGDDPSSTACDQPHTYGAAGSFTITVTLDDGDGGTGAASVDVVATDAGQAWDFDGFYEPVDNAPVVNLLRAGRTVPVMFSLGGDQGLDIFANGFPASVAHPCDGQAAADALESTGTPGASGLTYDPATGRYHYDWQTDRAWAGTCRRLVLRFVDGSEAVAEFRFR